MKIREKNQKMRKKKTQRPQKYRYKKIQPTKDLNL